jgi:hypothetical protein
VERSGRLPQFVGLRPGEDPHRRAGPNALGAMPAYLAGTIASAVQHGLVLYDVLERDATESARP